MAATEQPVIAGSGRGGIVSAWKQCPGCKFWKTHIVGLCGECRKAQDLDTATIPDRQD